MGILLSGGGDPKVVVPLDELFVSLIDLQKTVLYVPVAMEAAVYTYAQCFEWFKSIYNPYGIKHIELCTDLSSVHSLEPYSAVFIGGGNTFKLLKEVKESGFDQKLLDYLKNGGFAYGGSAGAILFGNSIRSATYADKNDVGLTDLAGLNVVNGYNIWCHYSEKEKEVIKEYEGDFYILFEESGLYIKDKVIKSVGKRFLLKAEIE